MPVVSNTSPLLNLAIIGQLPLLRQQFGEIWIPAGVLGELRVNEELPGCQDIRSAMNSGWILLKVLEDETLARVLRRDLDHGESEAIALAHQEKADCILIDEREGRRVARSMHLGVLGTLGVLVKARLHGHLPSLRDAMEILRSKAGFRIGDVLFRELLAEVGELET
jgi:predicted nucleic acid-binding protein